MEENTQANQQGRQSGQNFVNYGVTSQRNSAPWAQWNLEAQEQGLCIPVHHTHSFEPNQRKNFKVLFKLLTSKVTNICASHSNANGKVLGYCRVTADGIITSSGRIAFCAKCKKLMHGIEAYSFSGNGTSISECDD